MIYTPLVKKAMLIAEEAHRGQFDKGGYPYVFHPYAVAEIIAKADCFKLLNSSAQEHLICTAFLHDVLEDGGANAFYEYHLDQLPVVVKDALWLLTKDPIDSYQDYINTLTGLKETEITEAHRIACLVKQADLLHNLDESRIDNEQNEKTEARRKRYFQALFQVMEALGYYSDKS